MKALEAWIKDICKQCTQLTIVARGGTLRQTDKAGEGRRNEGVGGTRRGGRQKTPGTSGGGVRTTKIRSSLGFRKREL